MKLMPLMRALAAVLLRELDAPAFDLVDGADMNAVSADDFHVSLISVIGYPL